MGQEVILGLGSSLGDRAFFLRLAILMLEHHPSISVEKWSSVWGSLPVGEVAHRLFWNMAVQIQTSLSPMALLSCVMDIESRLGRRRDLRWADRTIDIDILLYEDLIVRESNLSIPHPELLNRGFVVQPLKEVAENWIHPTEGSSFAEMNFPSYAGLWKIGFLSLPLP